MPSLFRYIVARFARCGQPGQSGLLAHAVIIALGTLLSRLLGVLRDSALAWLLGSGATADALSTALRLPYLVRRLYGEGALSLELTVRCVHARIRSPQADVALAYAIGRYALPFCLMGLGLCLVAARPLMLALTPGLFDRPLMLDEVVRLFRLSAVYLPAALLAALCMAVLHGREIFAVSSLSTSLFNLIVLAFLAASACGFSDPATLAALGVAAGGLAQCLVQSWAVRVELRKTEEAVYTKNHVDTAPALAFAVAGGMETDGGEAAGIARRLPYGVLVAATPQLAFMGAAGLTSLLPDASLAALFYAERLLEFPLGVLGAAVGVAAAPRLARSTRQAGDSSCLAAVEAVEVVGPVESAKSAESAESAECAEAVLLARDWTAERSQALRAALAVNLPAAAGLMALAIPLTDFLFGHGAFTSQAVQATAGALVAYAPALPAYAASRPLLSACHACGDRRTPGWAMLAGLGVSLAAGAMLLPWLGAGGPPSGAALGLWVYALVLGMGGGASVWSQLSVRELGSWLVGTLLTYAVAVWLVGLAGSSVFALLLAVPGGVLTYAGCFGISRLWR